MEGREAHILNKQRKNPTNEKPHTTTSAFNNSFLKVEMKITTLGLATSPHMKEPELDKGALKPPRHAVEEGSWVRLGSSQPFQQVRCSAQNLHS